ncbi:MAG: hypothetical protein RXS23_09040 [Metallosphaera yellowstonensis]
MDIDLKSRRNLITVVIHLPSHEPTRKLLCLKVAPRVNTIAYLIRLYRRERLREAFGVDRGRITPFSREDRIEDPASTVTGDVIFEGMREALFI